MPATEWTITHSNAPQLIGVRLRERGVTSAFRPSPVRLNLTPGPLRLIKVPVMIWRQRSKRRHPLMVVFEMSYRVSRYRDL